MTLRLLAVAALLTLTGCSASTEEPGSGADPTRASEPSAASPSPEEGEPEGAGEPSASEDPTSFAAAVYYLGDTERAGPRLYREFRPASGDPAPATLELLAATPLDPDYRTGWQPGQLQDVVTGSDQIEVVVDSSARNRPAGMSVAEARAALQQVVYSLQAATQTRLPVAFRTSEGALDQVLGVPTTGPLGNGSMLQVLSHVSLTSPEQGAGVRSDVLEVSGVGNSFEANLRWEVRQGEEVVDRGFATMTGWMEDRLFPFETTVDVSGLEPGDYTLWVTTDDPSGGTEGVGAMTDDRDFSIS